MFITSSIWVRSSRPSSSLDSLWALDNTGAVARSLALSFYQNVGIAAPSLLPSCPLAVHSYSNTVGTTSNAVGCYPMEGSTISAIPLLWMASCRRYISSDPACWKVFYLMPALPVHRLDIIGGSATSSLLALCRSSCLVIIFTAAPDGTRVTSRATRIRGHISSDPVTSMVLGCMNLRAGSIREHASLDEWLSNSGARQFIVCHFFIGICGYMGREWELSYRLGMRP